MRQAEFTSEDLKNQLWRTLKEVRARRVDSKVANAVAIQAREIMRVVRAELQVSIMLGQKPTKNTLVFTGTSLPDKK